MKKIVLEEATTFKTIKVKNQAKHDSKIPGQEATCN